MPAVVKREFLKKIFNNIVVCLVSFLRRDDIDEYSRLALIFREQRFGKFLTGGFFKSQQ